MIRLLRFAFAAWAVVCALHARLWPGLSCTRLKP